MDRTKDTFMDCKRMTVAIIAKNAEATIKRAVESVLYDDPKCHILIVDDSENDLQAKVINQEFGTRVKLIKPPVHIGSGNARQVAIDSINTEFGVWLDADDEMLPGRIERIHEVIQAQNVDLIYEAAELYVEGQEGKIANLKIPPFLYDPTNLYWLYERNWFPILTGAFRTSFARSVGYDPSLMACEDYDFLVRAIENNAAISMVEEPAIKYYSNPAGLSRNIDKTVRAQKIIMSKLTCSRLLEMCEEKFVSREIGNAIVASRELRLEHYEVSHSYLENNTCSSEIAAPYNISVGIFQKILTSTVCFHLGKRKMAKDILEQFIQEGTESADILNNYGVVCKLQGRTDRAKKYFLMAIDVREAYRDARENLNYLNDSNKYFWTDHPLRRHPSNNIY